MTAPSDSVLKLGIAELSEFLENAFPISARENFGIVTHLQPRHLRLKLAPTAAMIRPGDIVSGPTLMGMADVAAYAVVLAHIGPVAMALTQTLSAAFMRPCRRADVFADARLMKLGKRSATVDVRVWQESEEHPVTQVTVVYGLP